MQTLNYPAAIYGSRRCGEVAGLTTCTLHTAFCDLMRLLRVGINSNIKSDEEGNVSLSLIDSERGGFVLLDVADGLVGNISERSSYSSSAAPHVVARGASPQHLSRPYSPHPVPPAGLGMRMSW